MKIFFILGVCFLCFNAVISRESTEVEGQDEDSTNIFSEELETNATLFDELELLDLPTLIELAEKDAKLAPKVAKILKQKFEEKTLIFTDIYHNGTADGYVRETYKSIYIQHFQTALKVLRNYSDAVQKVEYIHILPTNDLSKIIYKSVNLYCSKTLKRISIDASYHENTLSVFTEPFKSVDRVSLKGTFTDFGVYKFGLGEMFPAVRRLNLHGIRSKDLRWTNYTYPHLESLFVETAEDAPEQLNNKLAGQLIVKNPQIRELNLKNPSWNLLQTVAKSLSKLESLEMYNYTESIDGNATAKLHFKNVKILKSIRGSQTVPINSTFDSLTEFITDALPLTCSRWISLVETTKTLKSLDIRHELTNAEFELIPLLQHKLTKYSFKLAKDIQAEAIVKFIQSNLKIEEVVLELRWISIKPLKAVLRKQLGKHWKIKEQSRNYRYFLRLRRSH